MRNYAPSKAVTGLPHPDALAETAGLASIKAPAISMEALHIKVRRAQRLSCCNSMHVQS